MLLRSDVGDLGSRLSSKKKFLFVPNRNVYWDIFEQYMFVYIPYKNKVQKSFQIK